MNTASTSNGHLLVMAGGTGGHVFPALAVAKELQQHGTKITWLGTKKGLEASVIPANDISIEWVSVEGLRGKGKLSLLLAPFKLLRAMWQSASAIRKVQPDCILGMGGFVSGPGGVAARLLGRPLVVHEQNAVAGLTNKYLAKIASKVLTGFPKVADMPDRAQWLGNPVRETIKPTQAENTANSKTNVLIIGGSQGAHSFNAHLPSEFAKQDLSQVSIWHQSGKGRAGSVVSDYEALNIDAKVTEFIDDMAAAYAWADVLVCRAGAMTIAECCAAAKPALLIPYPFSAGDHQERNADVMVNVGAAKMILNHQLTEPVFAETLAALLADRENLKSMGQSAHTLHKPNALNDVVAVCQEYLSA